MASSENPQITLSPSRSISDICWLGISLHLGVDVAVDDAVAVAQLFDCQSLHRWLLAIQVTCFLFCPLICSSCCRAAAVAAVMLLLLLCCCCCSRSCRCCDKSRAEVNRANHVWQLLIAPCLCFRQCKLSARADIEPLTDGRPPPPPLGGLLARPRGFSFRQKTIGGIELEKQLDDVHLELELTFHLTAARCVCLSASLFIVDLVRAAWL